MTKWQTILIAAIVLPVAGFTAGAVMSSQADAPPNRSDIVVPADRGTEEPSTGAPTRTGSPSAPASPRTRTPSATSEPTEFTSVTPSPQSFDDDDRGDDDRDDDGGDDGGDDDSGSGSDDD